MTGLEHRSRPAVRIDVVRIRPGRHDHDRPLRPPENCRSQPSAERKRSGPAPFLLDDVHGETELATDDRTDPASPISPRSAFLSAASLPAGIFREAA